VESPPSPWLSRSMRHSPSQLPGLLGGVDHLGLAVPDHDIRVVLAVHLGHLLGLLRDPLLEVPGGDGLPLGRVVATQPPVVGVEVDVLAALQVQTQIRAGDHLGVIEVHAAHEQLRALQGLAIDTERLANVLGLHKAPPENEMG